jgi:hypothetical protein
MNKSGFGTALAALAISVLVALILFLMPRAYGAVTVTQEGSAQLPGLTIKLAPGPGDSPDHIDVTMTVTGYAPEAGEPLLRSAVVFAGVAGVAYGEGDVAAIRARDAQGPLELTQSVDEPDEGGFLYWRRWQASRAVEGDLTVEYRAPIELVVPRLGAGPPFDLRSDAGAVSAAANNFLVLPDTSRPFAIELDWDLSGMAENSVGVSSHGEGTVNTVGPIDMLIASYVMAGPVGRYRGSEESQFSAYWVGEPPFDPDSVFPWSEEAYAYLASYFGDETPPPFFFLARGNPYPGGGGAALINSFMLSYAHDAEDIDGLYTTIAHEMTHNWVTTIGGAPGSTSWYNEGMTVLFTRRLMLAAGLMTPDAFLADVNDHATRYYTNALNDLPNDEIAALFWEDTRVRSLPYDRGSMYFADVDAKVRATSGGERSIEYLLSAMNARAEAGEPINAEVWADMVAAELGEAAREDFHATLEGNLIVVPAEGAFGPCFERVEADLRAFELGFDPDILTASPRIVAGLVEGSEAAQAGLREGDEILRPVALESVQSNPEDTLVLAVRRGEEEFEIEYLPRAEPVEGYLWARKPGVADERCPL